ncbi:MAG: hypothetical protein HC879_14510 [Leptolyngbyaceae cyanobacterium SL_5_9]|nr:hypothetical protein [Leptolyngbyaceae cyanobacterium SL_5_9]
MLSTPQPFWLEGLDSLHRRSLLHRQGGNFSLDLMMKTYINECLEGVMNFALAPQRNV